jgi:hypothetical protein
MSKLMTYTSDKLQRGEAITTRLLYKITGTKTLEDRSANAALLLFDAASSQDQIDNFLGTDSEFVYNVAFGSTAMGTAALGGVIDMGGQLSSLESLTVVLRSGTDLATVVETTLWSDATALPNTLTNNVQVGANGNIGFHVVFTGLDALTAGQVELIIRWRAK